MRAPAGAGVRGVGPQREAVFGVDRDVGGVGKDAEAVRPGSRFEHRGAVLEQRDVAPELVDGKAPQQRALVRRQQADRAEDRGEHAAALDVGDEHPGRAQSDDEIRD